MALTVRETVVPAGCPGEPFALSVGPADASSLGHRCASGLLLAAAEAIADLVAVTEPGAGLLPDVRNLRATSTTVAVAVARATVQDGVAQADLSDPVQAVEDAMWRAAYAPLELE